MNRVLVIITYVTVFAIALFTCSAKAFVLKAGGYESNVDIIPATGPTKTPITGYGKYKLGEPISKYVTPKNLSYFGIDDITGVAIYNLKDKEILDIRPYRIKAITSFCSTNPSKYKGSIENIQIIMFFGSDPSYNSLEDLYPFLSVLLDVLGDKYSPFTADEYNSLRDETFVIQRRETPSSNVLEIGKYYMESGDFMISLQYFTDKYLKSFGVKTQQTINKL